MSKELLAAQEYCVLAFNSTHHALAAEKILQEVMDMMIIPTPRDISASCGLAIKIYQENSLAAQEILQHNKLSEFDLYKVKKQGKSVDTQRIK